MNPEYKMGINIDCEFTLTRYLYVTKYVKISLISALLEKNIDKALFWTFELYFSGLDQELFGLFWVVYYGFYASLNPEMYDYMVNSYNNWTICQDFDEKSKSFEIHNNENQEKTLQTNKQSKKPLKSERIAIKNNSSSENNNSDKLNLSETNNKETYCDVVLNEKEKNILENEKNSANGKKNIYSYKIIRRSHRRLYRPNIKAKKNFIYFYCTANFLFKIFWKLCEIRTLY